MRRNSFLIIFLILLISSSTSQAKSKFFLEPYAGYSVGYTKYVLEYTDLKSELEFPLDGPMIGGRCGFELGKDFLNIILEADLRGNITDPSGKFVDQDWFTGGTSAGYFDGQFSYTESEIVLDNIIASGKARYILELDSLNYITFYLGYRYQDIDIKAIGYSGWQIDIENDPEFRRINVNNTSDTSIIYRITYNAPLIGCSLGKKFGESLNLAIDGQYLIIIADDYDNHLLRGKDATSFGAGFGINGSLEMNLILMEQEASRAYLRFFAEGFYTNIKAEQTQKWYRDEGDILAGTSYSAIPHEISTLQLFAGLSIRMYF